jgi:hypothetical protein
MSESENSCGSVVVSCYCEKLIAEVGDSSGTEEKWEHPPLEAVIRQRLMKKQQTEKA